MDNQFKTNLLNADTWLRLLFIVLFCIVLFIVRFILAIVVALQFLFVLILGDRNENLSRLGIMLGSYVLEIIDYLTFNSSRRPFPFAEFPDDSREPEESDD